MVLLYVSTESIKPYKKIEKIIKFCSTYQFSHLMSRIVVKIVKGDKFEGNLPDDISVHIYNSVTSALVNIASGNLERNPYGTKNTISAERLSGDTFTAIVVPQNLERRTPLLRLLWGESHIFWITVSLSDLDISMLCKLS